jgi:hypothetical protein
MQTCETEASSLVARVRVIASTAQNSRTASTAVGGAVPGCGRRLRACWGFAARVRQCLRYASHPRHPRHPLTVGQVWKGVLREVEVLKILSHENVIQLCAPRPKQSRLLVVLGVLRVLGVCSDTCAVALAPIRFA